MLAVFCYVLLYPYKTVTPLSGLLYSHECTVAYRSNPSTTQNYISHYSQPPTTPPAGLRPSVGLPDIITVDRDYLVKVGDLLLQNLFS